MKIGMIWAQSQNGVIGDKGQLPWHLPEDLAHFKRITHGRPVIMGRKTWDSLPPRFRPLPGRPNLVISRQTGAALEAMQAQGALVFASLEEGLAYCRSQSPQPEQIWVIGGAQIYAQAEPLADWAEVTQVGMEVHGDAVAPALGGDWLISESLSAIASNGVNLEFQRYSRR